LDPYNIAWLVGLIVFAAFAALSPAPVKQKAVTALLIYCTVFVGDKLYESIVKENRLNRSTPAIDVDRAEIMLRIGAATDMLPHTHQAKSLIGGQKQPDVYEEAEKILKKAAESEKQSASICAKLAIVQHERKESCAEVLNQLNHIESDKGKRLYQALSSVYITKTVKGENFSQIESVLTSELPVGWYRDSALKTLYEEADRKKQLEEMKSETQKRSMILMGKLLALLSFGAMALLAGLIVIFVQLLFVARNKTPDPNLHLVCSSVDFKFRTIYGVFIGWMATQLAVGTIAQAIMKSVNPIGKIQTGMAINEMQVIQAGVLMALLYLFSNGPGPLYAYLFALRPNKLGFLDGLRIRTKVGKLGPFLLVLCGLCTWFAAIPLVIISYFIAVKIGSQGSSNPVLALVMEAARSPNPMATVIFYLTLGVLAPFCEETLFRGFLYSALRRKHGIALSMVFSAFCFAALHLDAGGFLPLFTLGCLFAFVFEKTKSIIPSMVAHGLWNSGTFTLVILIFGN
jgi:membrane protease YdiL (CAAX protease family)